MELNLIFGHASIPEALVDNPKSVHSCMIIVSGRKKHRQSLKNFLFVPKRLSVSLANHQIFDPWQ